VTFSQLQINVLVLVPLLGSDKKEFFDTTYLFVTIDLFSISFTCGTPGKYLPHLTRTTEETTKRQKKFTLASHMQRKTEKITFPYKRPTNYQEEESFCCYLQKIHHIYMSSYLYTVQFWAWFAIKHLFSKYICQCIQFIARTAGPYFLQRLEKLVRIP